MDKNWPPITEGTLTAAYSKNYKTARQAKMAFLDGADFMWNHPTGSTYYSVRDFQPGDVAKIRFANNRNVTFIVVPG